MKFKPAVTLVLLLLFSCQHELVKDYKDFTQDIISNPYKLRNMKFYFSDLYEDSLAVNTLKDSLRINETINNIENLFNKMDECEEYDIYYHQGIDPKPYYHLGYKGILNTDSLVTLQVAKGNYAVFYDFLKHNGKYFIFSIECERNYK